MVLRLSQEDLENLKYAELRKLAKEAGIKANMKVNTLSRNSISIWPDSGNGYSDRFNS